jgi:ribosomal protein S27AE
MVALVDYFTIDYFTIKDELEKDSQAYCPDCGDVLVADEYCNVRCLNCNYHFEYEGN